MYLLTYLALSVLRVFLSSSSAAVFCSCIRISVLVGKLRHVCMYACSQGGAGFVGGGANGAGRESQLEDT